MGCMVRINRLQRIYHGTFYVFHLLSDPMGLFGKLVHDISLVFPGSFPIEVLVGIVGSPVGEYSSAGERHFPQHGVLILLSSVSGTT